MIEFYSETEFSLVNSEAISNWIKEIIISEGKTPGEITYVFCDDAYLHKLNVDFLNHDTFTDIISFDACLGLEVNGEIYISVERVVDNAAQFKVEFSEELHRVMIHGILHFCGYNDKDQKEKELMKKKEDASLLKRSFD